MSTDQLQVSNFSVFATPDGELRGEVVFSGNLLERAFLRVRQGGLKRSGAPVKVMQFTPGFSPNPYKLNGHVYGLKNGQAYTFLIESYKGGRLNEKVFFVPGEW